MSRWCALAARRGACRAEQAAAADARGAGFSLAPAPQSRGVRQADTHVDRLSLSDLAGPLAVGSIAFAGAFLIVDGLKGLFVLIEQYAQTPTWAIVLAGPTIVLAYLFGVIAIEMGSAVRTVYDLRKGRDPVAPFIAIARLANEHLVARHRELRRHQAFLEGCSLSLAVLGVGAFFSMRWLGSFYLFGYVVGFGCLALAVVLPILAGRLAHEAFTLGEFADKELAAREPAV